MTRPVALTVSPHAVWGRIRMDSGHVYEASSTVGRLIWHVDDGVINGGDLRVEAPGHAAYRCRVVLSPGPHELRREVSPDVFTEDPLTLLYERPSALGIDGDHFVLRGERWLWKGSSEFNLPYRMQRGEDVRPRLTELREAGCNLVRLFATKKLKDDGGGWRLEPALSGPSLVRQVADLLGEYGLYGQWTQLVDTRQLMPEPARQVDFVEANREELRKYPHMLEELANERDHATQKIDLKYFTRPTGILSAVGSCVSDVQPGPPWWDYASWSARRTPDPPSPKPFTNLCPYVFRDGDPWPLIVPMVCNESVRPEHYGYNPAYAALMGRFAGIVTGGTFHSNAWSENRLWTPAEAVCARAFYEAMG